MLDKCECHQLAFEGKGCPEKLFAILTNLDSASLETIVSDIKKIRFAKIEVVKW